MKRYAQSFSREDIFMFKTLIELGGVSRWVRSEELVEQGVGIRRFGGLVVRFPELLIKERHGKYMSYRFSAEGYLQMRVQEWVE